MNIPSIGIIGGGRVTRILLGGFKAAGVSLPSVVVSDLNAEKYVCGVLVLLGGVYMIYTAR